MFIDDLNAIAVEILQEPPLRDLLYAARSQPEFVRLLGQVARTRGIDLSDDDVAGALNAARIAWFERGVQS